MVYKLKEKTREGEASSKGTLILNTLMARSPGILCNALPSRPGYLDGSFVHEAVPFV